MSSITLNARLEFQKVALGKTKEAHLLITLEGAKYQGERKPLSLRAVIDVSTSMTGQKLDYAKRSLKKLVEHMTDQDTLGILAFSSAVYTVVEPARMTQDAKDKALAEVEKLRVISDTNLSGATLEGYESIRAAVATKLKDSVERVFLFTDGEPTSGDTSFEGLVNIAGTRKPEGCGLTCFGYGTSYNKELLTAMAKAGCGNEYHIESPDQAPGAFGREIGGLLSCVAQAVKVTVATKPDVKIKEVLNDFDVKGNAEETEAVISVDDVYGGEKRRILLRLELPAMDKSGHPFKLGDVKVSYEDLLAKEPRKEEVAVKVEYVKDADADKESDKDVLEQVAVQAAARAQDRARQMADQGNFAGAQQAVADAALFCQQVGTVMCSAVAKDLDLNVMHRLSADHYAKGGAHFLRSNVRSHSVGRGQTLGTADLYNTKEQNITQSSFSADDDASVPGVVQLIPESPVCGVSKTPLKGPVPHVPARSPKTVLSKKRNRR